MIEKRDNKLNYSIDVFSEELCELIRYKLKLTKEQLPSKDIKKTILLSNELIGDWIVNNADGYIPHKNCGNLVVSKIMPPFFKENKYDCIEAIEKDPKLPDWRKASILRRFRNCQKKKGGGYIISPETFYYTFKIIWFNKVNCDFEKAPLYKFEPVKKVKDKLMKQVMSNKEYFQWRFEDFAKRGAESLSRNRRKRNSPERRESDMKLRALKNRKRGIK